MIIAQEYADEVVELAVLGFVAAGYSMSLNTCNAVRDIVQYQLGLTTLSFETHHVMREWGFPEEAIGTPAYTAADRMRLTDMYQRLGSDPHMLATTVEICFDKGDLKSVQEMIFKVVDLPVDEWGNWDWQNDDMRRTMACRTVKNVGMGVLL